MAIEINGTSGISGVDGSATTPALQGTDTNTGVTFGTDTVNVVTGGTTRATVDANGEFSVNTDAIFVDASADRVGIGTTTPSSQLELAGSAPVLTLDATGNNQPTINFQQSGTTYGKILFDGNNVQVGSTYGATVLISGSSGAERARVHSSGYFLFGTQGLPGPSIKGAGFYTDTNNTQLILASSTTSATAHVEFFNTNGKVGAITTDGTATTYGTSSDYRLKENVVNLDGAITRVKQLAPKRFNFIAEPSKIVDGFIAHEAQAVVPESVTGAQDATETVSAVLSAGGSILQQNVTEADWEAGKIPDQDGNTVYPTDSQWVAEHEAPVYQGIDQSKLVPLLTAALQEAIGKIEALETRVAQLEGGTN